MEERNLPAENEGEDADRIATRIMIGLIVAILVIVAALYEPTHGTVSTSRGDRYTVLNAGRYIGTNGTWTYFVFLAQDTVERRLSAEIGQLLHDVVGPLAERNGDSVLTIQAIWRVVHIGVLANVTRAWSCRFVKRDGEWVNIKY